MKNDPPPLPAGVYESSQVDVPPKARSQPRPNYPGELKRKRIEGEVLVLFTVEADGHVKDPIVLKATEVRFAKAATDGVLKWRYGGRDFERDHATISVIRNANWKILAQQVTTR